MYVRVLRHGDFFGIPEPLATFRLSTTSWSLALAREQAVQNRKFHRQVASAYPGLLSREDLVLGGVRSETNAWARRLVYLVLRRRLRVADSRPG
jgi:hypothetical protein